MKFKLEKPYLEPTVKLKSRVIVCLTTLNGRLVRTKKFTKPVYVGDPINAVKIFSEKGADELVLLEIGEKPFDKNRECIIRDIASEALMPISYGGGVQNLEQIRSVIRCGFEKVVLNTVLHKNLTLVKNAAEEFGTQSVIASIEVGSNWLGHKKLYTNKGQRSLKIPPDDWARKCEEAGCGEIILTSIDADGSMEGYDLQSIQLVSKAVSIPVIALGGAGSQADFSAALKAGASAVAAGSFFVFYGPRRAVLINYPNTENI